MSTKDQTRPQFSVEDAINIAKTIFDIDCTAREFPSERDRNFQLTTAFNEKYVLKISATSESREIIDYQNAALEHIKEVDESIAIPRIVHSIDGNPVSLIPDKDGNEHLVRVLTYLPGRVFAKVNPHTMKMMEDFGIFMGTLTKTLETFSHPASNRDFYWDLKNAPKMIAEYNDLISEKNNRELSNYFYNLFDQEVVPHIRELRQSVIHNDANDYNVVVDTDWPNDSRRFGIFDFGDMVLTCTIFDLAIATAYAILDNDEPIMAAAAIIRGYHSVYPITELEMKVLFPSICARLLSSVCVSAYQQSLEPDNEYLAITEAPAWRTLANLRNIHHRHAWYIFRDACGFAANPDSIRIVDWLAKNQYLYGTIFQKKLNEYRSTVLDLSVGSLDYEYPEDVLEYARATRTIRNKLTETDSEILIGRYDECRLIYTGDQYSENDSIIRNSRLTHIGIDIFSSPETPILAPLDGVVHSLRNNDIPLDYGPTIIIEHTPTNSIRFYTLYGHLSIESINGVTVGQKIRKGEEFARIGDYPTNGGWPPHLHFQIITDMMDKKGDYYGSCWANQRNIWKSICPDPNLILKIPLDKFPEHPLTKQEILQTRQEHCGPNLSVSYKEPLKIVRGYMQFLYDEDGKRYLDAVNNVPHVGHSNPNVIKTLQKQAAALYTNSRYLHENFVRYTEALLKKFPESLNVCYFVNSGSEANELALRLAKAHTKRDGFIVLEGAYHGNTGNLIGLSTYKNRGPGGTGPPDIVQAVLNPDPYRSSIGTREKAAKKHAEDVKTAIQIIHERGHPVAAFICEPVMSCAGQIVFPPNYLNYVYSHIREAGGICIADEVQIGLGRMGTHFWGFETQEVVPDIVTMGKPIGNGHPLAAVVTTKEIANSFNNGMEFFSTTGGNTVSCAVGLAVLKEIDEKNLQENAYSVGKYMKGRLIELQEKYPLIGDVRGIGLFLGVELVSSHEGTRPPAAEEAKYIVNRMKEFGVLLSVDGVLNNVLKIKPPIIFSKEDVDYFIERLDIILDEDFPRGIVE
ncbi:MAG: aminotransferase class III-fold pyridoxal phosphate-dependent enzyme [Candidatus Thorarchaeota archaeon]